MNGRLLLHQLRQLVDEGEGRDALLLEQFVQNQDEAAFARLLEQHGPMVWGVCRRVLRDLHLAEDAFQATFLVLLRRAGSITSRARLAGWLHGVACRVALKARAQAARRQARQRELQERAAVNDATPGRDDVSAVLDEEVQKLPARYREPIVLCYFEGKSGVEVARTLGLPEGTVHAWLTRARERLRARLIRRGLALTAAGLAALLENNLSAGVPPRVLEKTLLTARQTLAAGHPPTTDASALADATLKEQFMTKLKLTLAICALGAALIGTGLLAMQKDYSPREKITGKSAGHLPRSAGYQADLCRWLDTLRVEDFALEPGPLQYDGTFTDPSALANLWLEVRGARAYLDPAGEAGCKVLGAQPRWFVVNDGKQGGIEGTGTVRLFPSAVLGAYWYQRSLPLANGKQGNPFFQNAALGRRVLVCTAVDMFMQDLDHDNNDYNRRSDFLGGQLNAWSYSYGECKNAIDARGRAAFEAGFARILDKIASWGPRDVNTNMDIRVISSM
ncbi:MAG: RNA polymerase sigma factor, partial [Gemmataceae bacterium]